MNLCFAAIDFETANNDRDSACAVGLVKVADGKIIAKEHRLINPQSYFLKNFTENIHGIREDNVKDAPLFDAVWAELSPMLDGAQFIAVHNSTFDSLVLYECCKKYKIQPPAQRFVCTMMIARKCWNLYPTGLADVCRNLEIQLDHHNALSDAAACASILIKAQEAGYKV